MFDCEKVVDWNKRIASYTDETKAIYAECFKVKEEIIDVMTQDSIAGGWSVAAQDKKVNVFSDKKIIGNRNALRGKTEVPYDCLSCARYICNGDERLKWDDQIMKVNCYQRLGVNMCVEFSRSKRIYGCAARYMYLYKLIIIDDSGKVFLIMFDRPEETHWPQP
jgi:hypothetical protein